MINCKNQYRLLNIPLKLSIGFKVISHFQRHDRLPQDEYKVTKN